MTSHRYAFNAGEFSPELKWRSDLDNYSRACTTMENFLVTPQGPATTRWGSNSIAKLDDYDHYKIISFPLGVDESNQLIFLANTDTTALCQVWVDNLLVTTIDTNYVGAHIEDIQYFQSYDVIFLFHENYPVMKVSRTTETTFTFQPHVFNGGPFEDLNDDITNVITVQPDIFSLSATYDIGDIVSMGISYTCSGLVEKVFNRIENNVPMFDALYGKRFHYHSKITIVEPLSASDLVVGDHVSIDTDTDIDGNWEIVGINITENFIYINTSTYQDQFYQPYPFPGVTLLPFVNDYSGLDIDTDPCHMSSQNFSFYQNQLSGNIGQDPTTAPLSAWVERDYNDSEVNITTTFDSFAETDVTKKLRMVNNVKESDKGTWDIADVRSVSEVLPCYGTVSLKTEGGIWAGKIALQSSRDGGTTWEDIGLIESIDGNSNGIITREITSFNTLVRAYLKERTIAAADTGCIYYLEVASSQYTYFTISEYISTKEVRATIDNSLWNWASTWKWSKGVFGGLNGYPRVGTIFEERLVMAGVPGRPMNIYMSAINDFQDWIIGSLETSSLIFSLPSSIRQTIKWILPKQELLIGTDGGEWSLGARGIDQVLGAGNVRAKQHTSVGSKNIQAISTKDIVMYVERGGRSIRGLAYEFSQESYITTDLSILANHLTKNFEIVEIAYSTGTVPILWCRLADGKLITFSFEKNENVSAWTKQDLGGDIKSISVDPNDNVWAIIERNDGVFIETISEGNYHIDNYQELETISGQLYPLRNDENIVWNNEWIEENDDLLGKGLIINTAGTYPISISIDGVLLNENEGYIKAIGYNSTEFCYWVPTSGTVELRNTGAGSIMTPDVDYFVNPMLSASTFELYDDTDWGDIDVTIDGVSGQVRNTDYFTNGRIGIVPNALAATSGVIIQELSGSIPIKTYLSNGDMEYLEGPKLFSPIIESTGTKIFGSKMVSTLVTTDIMAHPQNGGPGSTAKVSELEIYTYNSVGGEFRFQQDDDWQEDADWQPILDLEHNTILGQAPEPQTKMHFVNIHSGYKQKGLFLQMQTDNPQHFTFAHLGIEVQRFK